MREPRESDEKPFQTTKLISDPKTGELVEVMVTVYPARWADGASRQIHGRKKNKSRP